MVWTFTGGLPETRCGKGSTLAATKSLRAALLPLIKLLNIRSLVDAPCGDCNWISTLNLAANDVFYVGADSDPANLEDARRRGMRVTQRNIIAEDLPNADLLFCRDFLQHLTDAEIFEFMCRHVNPKRYKFIALTSHDVDHYDHLAVSGQYRPINMTRAPFMWPLPHHSIYDGAGRIMGVWRLR